MAKANYIEVANVKISPQRDLIISVIQNEDKIVIGQKLKIKDEEGKPLNFFIKGALTIPVDKLYDFRNAIEAVIDKTKNI